MLSEQLTTSARQQQEQCNLIATNASSKDETNPFLAFENTLDTSTINTTATTTISMTKQLTTTATTTAASTISNSNLAPTAISPTTLSPTTAASSPVSAAAAAALRKSSICTASNASTAKTKLSAGASTVKAAAAASNDASGRSAALERAYVHDVYENCEEPTGPIRPRVAQFLGNLDPGSVVCDVGCGSGRYLTQCNPAICTVGVDRCYRLSKVAREKGGEVALCDNLELPFRDESFDAVLSLAVVHHFATTERRVSALRELARILRIGGRVVITVWALEQRHRRFESQDVLIPWQPPKNRNFNYSDEEDDDDFLPPYHAYTEDSTNSSRSAGDGDSSSLSSSSPGESCYSFVRRAIQKLASGRKHPWFLDSWTSKDTKNDSSLDYEDAKDLPIELRRLEDFEDFSDPPLSAGLKSRSLGSILNPPPRQIVRSRSSVPSLGGPLLHNAIEQRSQIQNPAQFLSSSSAAAVLDAHNGTASNGHSPTNFGACASAGGGVANTTNSSSSATASSASLGRRPKLIKQKQSLCDEDFQLPENPFHMISSFNSSSNSVNSSLYMRSGCYSGSGQQQSGHHQQPPLTARQKAQASLFLRKQSSLNEELMAGNRIREKERVRKRIQKQMSLNEAFLCRSALFSKRLQVIREGFTSKIKSSTGSLERVTKTGLTKIIQNFKTATPAAGEQPRTPGQSGATGTSVGHSHCQQHQHHHHHHHHQPATVTTSTESGACSSGYQSRFPHMLHKQMSFSSGAKFAGPVTYCSSPDCATTACYCSSYHHTCSNCSNAAGANETEAEAKARRHSRESGSDSSKDSSLQSDTSIESEDSFASVIFIPKPEQHQQQLNYQQQHQNSNSSSSNSSSSNGGGCGQPNNHCCQPKGANIGLQQQQQCKKAGCLNGSGTAHQTSHHHHHPHRIPSVPTSPLIMPCPPTPAHSPAAAQAAVTSPPQTMAAVTAAMAILTPPSKMKIVENDGKDTEKPNVNGTASKSRFNFDEAHIKQQQQKQHQQQQQSQSLPHKTEQVENKPVTKPSTEIKQTPAPPPPVVNKITRQTIKDLPPIPKFRKQQSLQLHRQSFPIVRRSSATSGAGIPIMPKLLSLELFNPATDDLDSDSSEPSSPDSIDSVISAPKSATVCSLNEEQPKDTNTESNDDNSDIANHADFEHAIAVKQQQYHNGDLKINPSAPNDIILNDDSSNILPTHPSSAAHNGLKSGGSSNSKKQLQCSEFAEKLSAQLLREIEDKNNRVECRSLDGIGDIGDYLEDPVGYKKRNGEPSRDLSALREELRERRLMLANLSTQPSLQQSPTSSSTSSLSSQTRSFTIHEEDEEEDEEENERSYTLQLYENCKISKFNYKRNRNYQLNPETAYLLQDDGDSSIRGDEDDDEDDVEDEHDVILEEDEDEAAAVAAAEDLEANSGDQLGAGMRDYARKNSRNTIKCDALDESPHGESTSSVSGSSRTQSQAQQQQQQSTATLQNRQSTESWEHSNSSTTSLDSPSQGGATTHHRYYHVFREGELDALINHHVASLHIVSSYYERASWCVVAEKVQVWTI